MAVEKWIHGKRDEAHHEGKRSEIRRIMSCEDQITLYESGSDMVSPIKPIRREGNVASIPTASTNAGDLTIGKWLFIIKVEMRGKDRFNLQVARPPRATKQSED